MSSIYNTIVNPRFDPGSRTYRVHHNPDNPWALSTTLVLSLSSLTGDDPTEMCPLNRVVDPDVLESHVRGRNRGAHVSFDFHGYDVTVRDDGRIELDSIVEHEV